MKTFTAWLTITALLLTLPFTGIVSQANAQTQLIDTEAIAEAIATDAGGSYIKGTTAPTLSGEQVALPVIKQGTNEILGFIVADQTELVKALNKANLTQVADAIGAVDAGTIAGTKVAAGATGIGISTLAIGAAVIIALAVAASSGDGDGGGGTPAVHH
jgi:hypothetical protein